MNGSFEFSLKSPDARPNRAPEYLRSRAARMLAALNSLPGHFYNRVNQQLLDAACSGLAVYVAFQLRFDGNVPAEFQHSMWTWMAALGAMRALAMRLTNAYRTIWRYFGLRDCAHFFLSSATPTLFLLALRIGSEFTRGLIPVPSSVLLLEFGLFSFLALGMRTLRRVSFEVAHQNARCPRALIVGSADTLATAVRQVISDVEVEVVGLLTPEPELHGSCVVGMPVLGSRGRRDDRSCRQAFRSGHLPPPWSGRLADLGAPAAAPRHVVAIKIIANEGVCMPTSEGCLLAGRLSLWAARSGARD